MKYLFLIWAFLLSQVAMAGQGSGNVSNVVQYGGGAITSTTANGVPPQITVPIGSLSNMVTLTGGSGSTSANYFYGFYSASSPTSNSAPYQVPSGKTLYVLGMYMAGTVGHSPIFGYGTATFTEASSSAPTGAVFYGPGSNPGASAFLPTATTPAYTYFPVGISFPANSYPFWKAYASSEYMGLILIGILQ